MKHLILALLLSATLAACERPAQPKASSEVRAVSVESLPTSPDDPAWETAPVYQAELRMQDMVEPRKMVPGTAQLRVHALTDGRRIALRLSWPDATADTVRAPAGFADACAMQFPATSAPDLPAPQMGEQTRPVEITYWSAAAPVDDIKALYPNAAIDHYPFTAPPLKENPEAREEMARLYAPARALDNVTLGKGVQDLMADGPGTLRPAATSQSEGQGNRSGQGWRVVLSRPLPPGSHVAFAVWNGSEQDAGSRKMWTPWIPFIVQK